MQNQFKIVSFSWKKFQDKIYRISKMSKYAECICVIAVTRTILGLLNTKGFQNY